VKTTDHIFILELKVRGVVVDDREEGEFTGQQGDNVIVGGRMDIIDLLLKTVLS
jgi:hypothetical protein